MAGFALGQAAVSYLVSRKVPAVVWLREWSLFWLVSAASLFAAAGLARGWTMGPVVAALAVVQPAPLVMAAVSVAGGWVGAARTARRIAAALAGLGAALAALAVLTGPPPVLEWIVRGSALANSAAAGWFAFAAAGGTGLSRRAARNPLVWASAAYSAYWLVPAAAGPGGAVPLAAGAILSFGVFAAGLYVLLERTRESERNSRTIVMMVADGVFVARAAGQFVEVNDAFCLHAGLAREDLLQASLTDVFEGPRRLSPSTRQVVRAKPSGKMLEISTTAVELSGGSCLIAVTHEVSGRTAMLDANARLAAIVENSDDAIIGKNLDGTVTSWNAAAERLFGYSAAEMIGEPVARLMPTAREHEMAAILDRIRRGELVNHFETERLAKDGRVLRISLSVSPIRDSTGRIVGASKVARDITEQKDLEERLRQSQKMEAVGQLAGGIAHDFNNLLTVINGYAALLEQQLDPGEPLRQQAHAIADAGRRAAALTQQLLAFSRRQVLAARVLDLNAVIARAEPLLRRLVRENIRISTRLDPRLRSTEADPHRLEQVLMNLVVNASDAMPAGGQLTVETANIELDEQYTGQRPEVKPGSYVMMAVSDTGHGMDPAVQSRIFEPFFTTKAPGQGTGLGLSTAWGIVRQTGGHIGCYSQPGLGTTFRVYLPASEGPPVREAKAEYSAGARGHETILLVEDDAALRQYAATVLRDLGYAVLEAGSGTEGLAIGANPANPIDLLITDLVMPGIGGRELAEALRRTAPRMRVLYISGYAEHAITGHGMLSPGLSFLSKPFSPARLADKVRETLVAAPATRSVLLVDDDADVRDVLSGALTAAGYAVEVAADGAAAVALCRQKAVDLLVADSAIRDAAGLQAIAYFTHEVPHLPVIVISGNLNRASRELAREMGARLTLQKPIQPEELLKAVRDLIG